MSDDVRSCFRVERRPAYQAGPKWRAAAVIVRADTDEPMERLSVSAATADAAETQLDVAVAATLATLTKPRDWGRDATVVRLVQRYLQLNDELYGLFERGTDRAAAEAYEQQEMQALRARVAALTETQREELATPTEAQLARLDDPYVIDDLTAKQRLCRLMDHQSAAVAAGCERIAQALGA